MPATTANKRLGLKSSPVGCRTITTPKNPTKTPTPINRSKRSPRSIGDSTATTKGDIKSSVSALGIGFDFIAAKKNRVAIVSISPLKN